MPPASPCPVPRTAPAGMAANRSSDTIRSPEPKRMNATDRLTLHLFGAAVGLALLVATVRAEHDEGLARDLSGQGTAAVEISARHPHEIAMCRRRTMRSSARPLRARRRRPRGRILSGPRRHSQQPVLFPGQHRREPVPVLHRQLRAGRHRPERPESALLGPDGQGLQEILPRGGDH